MADPIPLTAAQVCLRCDPTQFDFETTAELTDLPGNLGQMRAEEALRFGLAMRHSGYHVYALGEPGTGRHAMVLRVLRELAAARRAPDDLCYLQNFDDPLRPRLLTLPAGRGAALRADMQAFIRELGPAIDAALESEPHVKRIEALQEAHKHREEAALREIGQASGAEGLDLLRTPEGFVFAPKRDGETLSPEAFEALPEAERKAIEAGVEAWSKRLADLLTQFPSWRKALHEAIRSAERDALAPTVAHLMHGLRERYADLPQVQEFIAAISRDLLDSGIDWGSAGEEDEEGGEIEEGARFRRYQVNLLVDNSATEGAPVISEDNPGFANLIGRIEHLAQMGTLVTNFTLIRAGALHRACGGYLVLDAERLLAHPFAWEGLKRVLRGGAIRIEAPSEVQGWSTTLTLDPQPVPCEVKLVLVGDRELFYLLADADPDFGELFKVAADFDEDMPRTAASEQQYARLLAGLGRDSGLLPFDRSAIARLVEAGARHAEDSGRLSLHTRRLSDLMREADYHARREGRAVVACADIEAAAAARRRRFGRYPERVRESMQDGTVLIATEGAWSGQINGLVVVDMGDESFGHPMRITATVRVGEGDVLDIERETELGGAIHSKGVLILSAFLGARYARHQPLSLAASLVFEQSYTPVEGDSASLAELCALLSALADVPIRQCFAVTGSVNQFGVVQAIGGVNEKIEGFFDLCAERGLSGEQGALIPASCVRHLMLREDVVAAIAAGRFHIHAVETVDQAMTLLTGLPAGTADAKGVVPKGTINHRVATVLADMAATRHGYDQERERPVRRRRQEEH